MQKTSKFFISLLVFFMLVAPAVSFAVWKVGDPLVPCDGLAKPCDFNALMDLVNIVIKFVLFYMAVPIAAIMFIYAGIKLVTSGGSTEARTKAKSIFTNAVIGLVLAAAAWLIVRTILFILGYKGDWILLNF